MSQRSQVPPKQGTDQGTRSPNELFWTAKKQKSLHSAALCQPKILWDSAWSPLWNARLILSCSCQSTIMTLQAEVRDTPVTSELHQLHQGPRQSREADQTCSASIFTADFHCDFLLKEDLRFRDKFGDSGDGEKDIYNRVHRKIKKFSKSHCLLIYFVPLCIKAISANILIFRAFSSLGHHFEENALFTL